MKMRIYRLLLISAAVMIALTSCDKEKQEEVERVIERSTVTDLEGNVYQTVKIGDQWWMAENLLTTKFNDGTDITLIPTSDPASDWSNNTNPCYTEINKELFGLLYNGAVINSEKNIAPDGWHVPTDEDWIKLEKEIGMSDGDLYATGWRGENEAIKLTTKYSIGWPEGRVLYGTDEYGFNAKPGGCRIFDGNTNISTNTAFWWTDTNSENELWYRYFDSNEKRIFRQHTYKGYGMSIRCVKD
jgi:uncharacterized protein (TIGR02145 family)